MLTKSDGDIEGYRRSFLSQVRRTTPVLALGRAGRTLALPALGSIVRRPVTFRSQGNICAARGICRYPANGGCGILKEAATKWVHCPVGPTNAFLSEKTSGGRKPANHSPKFYHFGVVQPRDTAGQPSSVALPTMPEQHHPPCYAQPA